MSRYTFNSRFISCTIHANSKISEPISALAKFHCSVRNEVDDFRII
jgi:hypothetical protein